MKRLISIMLTVLIVMLVGCSSDNKVVKNQNEQLKSRISQLEKDLNVKNSKLIELQNKELKNLTINYVQNTNNKRFVEKQRDLFSLPSDNTIKLNSIEKNTVVTVLDTANVNNIIWLYISIPVYNSPSNYKGWIKESDSLPYTKDKISKVQSDVKIRKGEDIYEVDEFADIKSAKPHKAQDGEHGRIGEKKDRYISLQCSGGKTIWVKEDSVIYPEIE